MERHGAGAGARSAEVGAGQGIGRLQLMVMSVASAMAVANLYYNQPLLADIGRSFQVSVREVGFIPMLTQVGYAVGLFLFVPLGDVLERRRLILGMLGAVSVALVGAALAPSVFWLSVASLLVGITTIVPQLLVPLAAHLARPEERGKVVGTVMSGLLIGILLARTVSGFVGAHFGWRAMYLLAAGMMVALAFGLRALLPPSPPGASLRYPALLRSMWGLLRSEPALREAAALGALAFGAFSAFWTTLVFLLERPPYGYGSEAAGLFGLLGAAGALAAPFVGRWADRRSPRFTAGLGLSLALVSFLVLGWQGERLWALVLGVLLLDLGVQANQISNQTRIYALMPAARNRLNTVYMVSYFCGGALGTYLGALAWSVAGWKGVCVIGVLLLGGALAVFARGSPRRQA